jgi:predicted nucleic acid-binding protein
MTSTLVDSNVIIDVLKNAPLWNAWSRSRLREAADSGSVVVNQVIVAESSIRFRDPVARNALEIAELSRESIPWEAAFKAGEAHRAYRDRGGWRERTLPDFLIGAHAAVKGYRLLTRDPRRYRQYFPELELVAPDTHP